jgi:molybdate transport system regulatory protein
MKARQTQRKRARLRFQIRPRLYRGGDIAIGPGKADLLGHIAQTGSLRKAAAAMEMSYMRAWMLVRTMNRCFKQPLVATKRGGAEGGEALLTETGQAVLAAYRHMEAQTLRSTKRALSELSKHLR